MKPTHHLRLTELAPGVTYRHIDFGHHIEDAEAERNALADPIGFRIFGDTLPYDSLFTYLFRRFGYPNQGWDDYKELAKYLLNTPDRDLVLIIVPSVSGRLRLSYSFYATTARADAVEAFDRRHITAWTARSLEWAEARGLPAWMPEWLVLVNEEVRPLWQGGSGSPEPITDWRESLRFAVALGREGDPLYAATSRAAAFARELHEAYSVVEPWPGAPATRSPDIESWSEDDPLKPLALAARAALTNLLRGVRVRDSVINALGEDDSGRPPLQEPAVAGYPSGALGNVAPEEMAQLHQLVYRLGRGNPKKGLRALLEKFSDD